LTIKYNRGSATLKLDIAIEVHDTDQTGMFVNQAVSHFAGMLIPVEIWASGHLQKGFVHCAMRQYCHSLSTAQPFT